MQRRCTLSCKWMREGGREEEGEGEGERERERGKVRVGVGERVLYMYIHYYQMYSILYRVRLASLVV